MYEARKDSDGTYSIFGVPVFGELPKGARGNDVAFGKDWMRKAIARCKQREGEGYKYRLHVFHHEPGDSKPTPAGTFTLTCVKTLRIGGKPMPVLHADFRGIDEWTFERIQRGELLYRSVEILNVKGDPEIDSIALLSTETPYFRLPVTDGETVRLTNSDLPTAGVVGFYTDVGSAAVVFSAKGLQTMKQMTLKLKGGKLVGTLEGGDEFSPSAGAELKDKEFVVKTASGEYVATFDGSDDDERKALKAEVAKLRKKLKQAKPVEVDELDDDEAAEPKGKKAAAAATLAADAETAARFDAMSAEIEKLKAERAEDKKAQAVEARTAAALSALRKDGYHVSDYTAGKIATFAASGDEAVAEFVEHYRKVVPKDGPKTLADSEAGAPNDPLMAKFSALGAEANDLAIEAAAHFDGLVKMGFKDPKDRDGFITRFMANRGVKLAG